jgi:hypothetical protein
VAFFSSQINWSEPWFFLVRIRERPGWIKRGAVALGLSIAMFLAIYFGGRHANWSIPAIIGLSGLCGVTLVALVDVPNLQRDVTIKDDCIIVGNSFGKGNNFSTFEFKHIEAVELLHSEDWKRPWGAMLIEIPGDTFLVAVPRKIALETVANILHRLDVPVALRGWEPTAKDTRVQVQDEIVIDPASVRGVASFKPVGPGEPKLTPASCMAVQIIVGLGPAILTLIGMIAAGIYIAMNWNTLSGLNKVLIGGGAFAAFVVSVMFLIFIGLSISNSYAVRVGEKQLRLRSGSLFRGDETDLTALECYDRAVWTAVLFKSNDFGFLQVDPPRRMLRFEGEKNRWEIPLSALTACRIEESHVGSEANENAEKRYLVALAAQNNGEPWEVGLVPIHTAIGSDNKDRRSARAKSLFQQIAAAANA